MIRHLRDLKESLKLGFSATVSDRALMSLLAYVKVLLADHICKVRKAEARRRLRVELPDKRHHERIGETHHYAPWQERKGNGERRNRQVAELIHASEVPPAYPEREAINPFMSSGIPADSRHSFFV